MALNLKTGLKERRERKEKGKREEKGKGENKNQKAQKITFNQVKWTFKYLKHSQFVM